jgi:hypothetical protein
LDLVLLIVLVVLLLLLTVGVVSSLRQPSWDKYAAVLERHDALWSEMYDVGADGLSNLQHELRSLVQDIAGQRGLKVEGRTRPRLGSGESEVELSFSDPPIEIIVSERGVYLKSETVKLQASDEHLDGDWESPGTFEADFKAALIAAIDSATWRPEHRGWIPER